MRYSTKRFYTQTMVNTWVMEAIGSSRRISREKGHRSTPAIEIIS